MIVDQDGDVRYYGVYEGRVEDNSDPREIGRVRATVPGILASPAPWARPMGHGGEAERGLWQVPGRGAAVAVQFLGGDPDYPVYQTLGRRPGDVPDATDDGDPDVLVLEGKGYEIVMDERIGKKSLIIRDKAGGGEIEFDGLTRGVAIKGTLGVNIEAVGSVAIKGLVVAINGRTVDPVGGSI